MNVYLTNYRTAFQTESTLMSDVVYPQKVHYFPDTFKRAKTGLFYAPQKLGEKVLDLELLQYLRDNPAKTAFILAAGNSHFAGIGPRPTKDNELSYVYKFLPLTLTQVYAGRLAQACGAHDLITTDATACASSLKALMDVQTLIKFYGFDRVIVLSHEDPVSNSVLEFFGETRACLTHAEEVEQQVVPSAFDSNNRGFYVGQGAVFAVFESEKIAKTPKAQLVAAYTASEACDNALGQLENGQGFKNAIRGAMHFAALDYKQIKVIKTHGTGTKSNNTAEKAALFDLFNGGFVATSYKPTIGHTMGASGLLESCMLLNELEQTGMVPAIKNRTEDDHVYLSKPTKPEDGLILSLAAGMGNVYSAAIFDMKV